MNFLSSRLAAKLHSQKISGMIEEEQQGLKQMTNDWDTRQLSEHTLRSMRRAAVSLVQGLRKDEHGAHMRGSGSEKVSDFLHKERGAIGAETQARVSPRVQKLVVQQTRVETAPQHGDTARAAAQIVPVPEGQRNSEPQQSISVSDTPASYWSGWGSSACRVPDLPVVRGPLCDSTEIADGTCQITWGDLPEIIGEVVELRVERREALSHHKGPPELVLDVATRTRRQGEIMHLPQADHDLNIISKPQRAVASDSWEGYAETIGADALGVVKGTEIGGDMSWMDGNEVLAKSR